MEIILNEREIMALYDFADKFNFGDLHQIIGDKLTEEQIFNLDRVLERIFNSVE